MTEDKPELSFGVPVFPLPDITLFPHTHLPLHIFEQRYRNLMEDTLKKPAEQHCIVMGTQAQKPADDTLGDPPVHIYAGAGRLEEYSRLDDGRYMLVLRGIGRVRLTAEQSELNGYRMFDAEWLPDVRPGQDARWEKNLAIELKGLALALLREQADKFREMLTGEIGLGTLTDMICGYLPFPPEFKLRQMGVPNVIERAAATISHLETLAGFAPEKPLKLDDEPPQN